MSKSFAAAKKALSLHYLRFASFVRFFNISRQSEAYLCTNLNTYNYGEIYYQIGVADRAT